MRHSAEDLAHFNKIAEQKTYRTQLIVAYLESENIHLEDFDAFVGRGGLIRPIPGGTYLVNEKMLEDLSTNRFGEHAADLGALIAWEFAQIKKVPAYIVNPIVVDEMEDVARISGMPEIERYSIFHALNQKAVAISYSESLGKTYQEMNLIVVHLGGGISIGAHQQGRVVDVNNALNGEGPFSPERSGGLPAHSLMQLCFSGQYTKEQLSRKISGVGGLVAYLGTNDCREVVVKIQEGDRKSKLIYQAMAYQTAKEIGAAATVLKGKVDAILITGGIAHDALLTEMIRERVDFIAPVKIIPGEKEMQALAEGALRVLREKEEVKNY